MNLSTKSLTSLLLVTAVASALPGISQVHRRVKNRDSRFDRILQRHDRKGELRAEVLGLTAPEFRSLQRKMPFEEIAKKSGFATKRAFRVALLGKLKNQLHQQGWSSHKIESFVNSRSSRLS